FLDQVGRAAADGGGVAVGRAEPLVADGVVALAGGGRSGEGRPLLDRPRNGRGGHRRGRVQHLGGGGAGGADGGAVVVGGRGHRLEGEALVAFLDQVGRAAADGGGVAVGRAEPLVADGVVALAGGGRSGEGRPLLDRPRNGRGGHRRG